MKFIRKLYEWVLHWSETRYGPTALFVLAFTESSFFPIPPDALLIALVLGSTKKAFKFAAICLTGSVAGAVAGYLIGHFLWWTPANEFTAIAQFFFNNIPGFTTEQFYEIIGGNVVSFSNNYFGFGIGAGVLIPLALKFSLDINTTFNSFSTTESNSNYISINGGILFRL